MNENNYDVDEILSSDNDIASKITLLKNKSVETIDWSVLVKDYDPLLHKIVNDKDGREDKTRSNGKIDQASRIYIGLEKLLTKRITEFTFAIPIKRVYSYDEGNAIQKSIVDAIEAIYKHARIDTENIKRGNAYYASCEIFTIWYCEKKQNSLYGFDSSYKLKCKTYSPMDGVSLWPLFDELGDMLAMSFEYVKTVETKKIVFFETYTATRHIKWSQSDGGEWKEVNNDDIVTLNKIPGVYLYRQYPVYHGLTKIREEIEYALSRNSDVVAYNSAPVLKVSGLMKGEETKGTTQRIFRVENGGDVSYVSWQQANSALEYHVRTMLELYWMQAQMPDISATTMAKLGNIGYDARQTILTDAHLRIGDESGPWIEAFEREFNVIKAFLGEMNTKFKTELDKVTCEHIISPFIQNDEMNEIKKWQIANGGKPLISQIDSIKNAGLTDDAEQTYKTIQEENRMEAENRMRNILESEMVM